MQYIHPFKKPRNDTDIISIEIYHNNWNPQIDWVYRKTTVEKLRIVNYTTEERDAVVPPSLNIRRNMVRNMILYSNDVNLVNHGFYHSVIVPKPIFDRFCPDYRMFICHGGTGDNLDTQHKYDWELDPASGEWYAMSASEAEIP